VSAAFFPNFEQNLLFIRCSKTDHLFLQRDVEKRFISTTTSTPQLALSVQIVISAN
jgi:hypothetical protein